MEATEKLREPEACRQNQAIVRLPLDPFFSRDGVTIFNGDCREVLKSLPDCSVNCCVTSPPYWGLRDYGHDEQIGLEPTPEKFVANLLAVFKEVRRVLTDDGTLWLNLGDTYASNWPCNRRNVIGSGSLENGKREARPPRMGDGLKDKDLVGIPWRVAFALQADGWYLRQDIIWAKPNPMPESVEDRCTKSHEYLFLLTKSARYHCDMRAIAEAVTDSTVERLSQPNLENQAGSDRVPGKTNGPMKAVSRRNSFARAGKYSDGEHGQKPQHREDREPVAYEGRRNKRSVWTVTTQPYKGAHFATFPPALIEPCIRAGCPDGGVVLDPFLGSGTTAEVAQRQGCRCVGIELNADYARLAAKRFRQRTLLAVSG